MNNNIDSAREDLALIRAIVDERGKGLRSIGMMYCSAGLIFGTQTLLALIDLVGLVSLPERAHLYITVIALTLFFGHSGYEGWRHRGESKSASVASRAIGAAFGGAGLANAVLAIVFGYVAMTRHDMTIWYLFPVVVCALQGAVWFAVALIQRRWWMGTVAAGWFVAGLVMGLTVDSIALYLFTLMVVLYGLLGVPGLMMVRVSKEDEQGGAT